MSEPDPPRRFDFGIILAVLIVSSAAATLFLVHGIATAWNVVAEKWDGIYYYYIALNGYVSQGYGGEAKFSFLPGYSILLIPATRLLPSAPFLASFLTSSALTATGGALLYRLLRSSLRQWPSLAAIALLAFSPFAIYLYDGYAEAALFACVAGALLCLHSRRILGAAALAGFALICRPHAIALLPLFAVPGWRLLRTRQIFKLGLTITLISTPFILYAIYMLHLTGDSLIIAKRLTMWTRYGVIAQAWPIGTKILYSFYYSFREGGPNVWALSLGMFFLSWAATLKTVDKIPAELLAYGLLTLAFVFVTDALVPLNLGRHSMAAFTIGPALAACIYPRTRQHMGARVANHLCFISVLLVFVAMFVMMAQRFSLGQWVS